MSPGQGIGVGWDHGQGQSVTDGMGSPQVTEGSGHRHAITLATEPLHRSRGSDRLADCPNFSLPARRWGIAARYGSERRIGVRSSGFRTHLQI